MQYYSLDIQRTRIKDVRCVSYVNSNESVYTRTRVCLYVCVCRYVCERVYMCVAVYVREYVCVSVWLCMCVCMCICVCECVRTYVPSPVVLCGREKSCC